MAHARDEHARQHGAQGIENDTNLMEPELASGVQFTNQGAIPPVADGFATPGPTASDRAYGGYVRVLASTLNVRSSPSKESKANIVGKLHRGALVEQTGREGDWVKINFHGESAYVHHAYVAIADTRPSDKTKAELMQMFREVNGEPGRGKPPSAETRAELMKDFREVNGDHGRGAPPSAETRAELMQDFREVNGDQGRGAPPSAETRAELMQMFREVNGEPGRGAPPSAEVSAELLSELE